MTNPNDTVSPIDPNLPHSHPDFNGLTKREYFAGLAMQGLLANPDPEVQCTNIVAMSVGMADSIIAELNKKEPKNG